MMRALEAIGAVCLAAIAGALFVSGLWAVLAVVAGLISFARFAS